VTTGTTPAARPRYRQNLEALLRAQKPSFGTPAYSRFVNRPLGRRVAAFGHSFGLTPNIASAISALLSGLAIVLLGVATPTPALAAAVATLLAAGYVMDSVDGQLARLRVKKSVAGEWLDHTIDTFKTSSLHLAVLVSLYRHPPLDGEWILIVPLVYEVVQTVTYFGLLLMPDLRRRGASARVSGEVDRPSPSEHPLRAWLILPTDYGFLCWIFLLLAWPVAFFWAYTAVALLSAAMLALALRKWWRELRALDAARA
jgi:phosphatidylglycerophosphate synthase